MGNTRNNKGITLIALVITIIVLLILATVSIATLTGENGILTKANTAKDLTIEAEEKEQINLAYTTVMAKKLHNSSGSNLTVSASELGEALKKQNAGAITVEDDDKIKVTFTNSKNVYTVNGGTGEITSSASDGGQTPNEPEFNKADTVVEAIEQDKPFEKETRITDGSSKVVIIPAGFKIAEDSAELVENGVVIEDTTANKNQFVWVPVDNIDDFVRQAGYCNGAYQDLTNYTEPCADGYSIQTGTEKTTEQSDYEAMKQSVKDNKGFYIGRFETGRDINNSNIVIKKGAYVYNNVPWGKSMSDVTQGAVKLSKEFASNNGYQGVTSTLCYGVQWDATVRFINSSYINSSGEGWYMDNYNSTNSGNIEMNPYHITGLDLIYNYYNYKVANREKNIYDMAGNVFEWTMEACSTGSRVNRGGSYNSAGQYAPISFRNNDSPEYASEFIGFRVALYL